MMEFITYPRLEDVPANVREAFETLHCDTQGCHFLLAHRQGEPLGIAKLIVQDRALNIEMIKVLPQHQHHGVATSLLERIFTRAADEGLEVTTAGFTADGAQYLRHIAGKLGKDHGVPTQIVGIC